MIKKVVIEVEATCDNCRYFFGMNNFSPGGICNNKKNTRVGDHGYKMYEASIYHYCNNWEYK